MYIRSFKYLLHAILWAVVNKLAYQHMGSKRIAKHAFSKRCFRHAGDQLHSTIFLLKDWTLRAVNKDNCRSTLKGFLNFQSILLKSFYTSLWHKNSHNPF